VAVSGSYCTGTVCQLSGHYIFLFYMKYCNASVVEFVSILSSL